MRDNKELYIWTAKGVEEASSAGNQNWGSCEIVTGVPMQTNSKLLSIKKQY